jgi:hypothetical protein
MFDVLREWFSLPSFHGCAFLNASGEIGAPDDPIRVVAREHKVQLLQFVETLFNEYFAQAGGSAREAPSLARQWLILIDGAIGVALVSGTPDAAADARAAAERLLDAIRAVPERSRSKKKPGKSLA